MELINPYRRSLELLAPAKNKEIGIAAINCGADAVYIAAERFGARKAAGNSLSDIAELCVYAHRFGAKVYATVNTIFYDSEVRAVQHTVVGLVEAGIDALIVQDMGLLQMIASGVLKCSVPLHASTQCAVRMPEKAVWLASLGFSRIVLERQLSLEQISAIALAVPGVEIEAFVHGAICTGYSGQCYLSEALCGRSANRGECAQACRSRYDLVASWGCVVDGFRHSDAEPIGRSEESRNSVAHFSQSPFEQTILRDKPLLSLKDNCLIDYLPQLAQAGVMSFKIEGRLKGMSYVKNVVRVYSAALNSFIVRHSKSRHSEGSVATEESCARHSDAKPAGRSEESRRNNNIEYRRLSYGNRTETTIDKNFLSKTFNRGYTSLYIEGKPDGSLLAGDLENGIGEYVGEVISLSCTRHCDATMHSCHSDAKPVGRSEESSHVEIIVSSSLPLHNADGFSVELKGGQFGGFRASKAERIESKGNCRNGLVEGVFLWRLTCESVPRGVSCGSKIYRNFDFEFEKSLEQTGIERYVPVSCRIGLTGGVLQVAAIREDGTEYSLSVDFSGKPVAINPERVVSLIKTAFSKKSGDYVFELSQEGDGVFVDGQLPLVSSAELNEIRRRVADELAKIPYVDGVADKTCGADIMVRKHSGAVSYRDNVANSFAAAFYDVDDLSAYELRHPSGAELMRTKHCIRRELGLCERYGGAGALRWVGTGGAKDLRRADFFLVNNGVRLSLSFDCQACEMIVKKV